MSRLARRALIVVTVVALWVLGAVVSRTLTATSESGSAAPSQTPSVASSASSAPTAAPPTSSASPSPRAATDTGLGVQLTAHHAKTATRALEVMDLLSRAGATWVRIDVGWNTLEPKRPGAFSPWYEHLLDAVIAGAHERHLKVIFSLWLTPKWASPTGSYYAPPTDVGAYASAIGRAAQRWGDDVDAWEVWNEPNFSSFFEGADPRTYTNLLCAAYPAVKKYDSSPVLFGGLMYNDDAWLKRAYAAGARDCFDALAVHPYVGPSDAAPNTPAVGQVWRLTHMPTVRAVMDDWGDSRKRIWITELGWSTGPDSEGNPWNRPVSERKQARFLRQAVHLVRTRYPYVGPIIWYRDVDGPTAAYQDGFGLLHHDLRPKPALRAFTEAVRAR